MARIKCCLTGQLTNSEVIMAKADIKNMVRFHDARDWFFRAFIPLTAGTSRSNIVGGWGALNIAGLHPVLIRAPLTLINGSTWLSKPGCAISC